MAYTIEIFYRTGDSFHSRNETEQVGCVWEDKEQAQLALSYIKDHYEHYKQVNGWNAKVKEKDILKVVMKKPWACEESEYWQFTIMVPVGNEMQRISAFWCGYFEELHSGKIVCTEDDKDSFSF